MRENVTVKLDLETQSETGKSLVVQCLRLHAANLYRNYHCYVC